MKKKGKMQRIINSKHATVPNVKRSFPKTRQSAANTDSDIYVQCFEWLPFSNMTSKDFNAIVRGACCEIDVTWTKKDRKVDREEKSGRCSSTGRRIGPEYPPHL